jgi:hypothetical protein
VSARFLLAVLAFAAGAGCTQPADAPPSATPAMAPSRPDFDRLLLISVDGLRPEAIAAANATHLPGFGRLLAGASTLDARTDPDWTTTLPNHTGMMSGRFVEGVEGHNYRQNDIPPPEQRLRSGVSSVFDAASAAGLRCALVAAKPKFVLYPRTWNGMDFASPAGPIHFYAIRTEAEQVGAAVLDFWSQNPAPSRCLMFAHLREPDSAGHDHGWDLDAASPYSAAVARVDQALMAIFGWLDERPELRARTAIILTADHGGGVPFKSHYEEGRAAVNFTIPFVVWTGDARARGDLYDNNPAARARPGERDPRPGDGGLPPIRNADCANLALGLLGLPPIPGSTVNPLQDLRIEPVRAP